LWAADIDRSAQVHVTSSIGLRTGILSRGVSFAGFAFAQSTQATGVVKNVHADKGVVMLPAG